MCPSADILVDRGGDVVHESGVPVFVGLEIRGEGVAVRAFQGAGLCGAFHGAALSGRRGSDSTVARAGRIVHRYFDAAAMTRVMPFAAACSTGICAYAFSSFGTTTDSAAITLPVPSRTGTATPVVSGYR